MATAPKPRHKDPQLSKLKKQLKFIIEQSKASQAASSSSSASAAAFDRACAESAQQAVDLKASAADSAAAESEFKRVAVAATNAAAAASRAVASMQKIASSLEASSISSAAAAAAARTAEAAAVLRTTALDAQSEALRARLLAFADANSQMIDGATDTEDVSPLSPPPPSSQLLGERLDDDNDMDTSVLSPVSLLMGLSGRGSDTQPLHLGGSRNLNDGQGKALDLAFTGQYVSAGSARTTQAHLGVAQGGETLAAATAGSSQSSAGAGGSAMDIADEDVKEEKGNEVDRRVTSSGVMEMSSTEEEVNPPPPHPLHSPPHPPHEP